MNRFRQDNTTGYSDIDLTHLNQLFLKAAARRGINLDAEDIGEYRAILDAIAIEVREEFDRASHDADDGEPHGG